MIKVSGESVLSIDGSQKKRPERNSLREIPEAGSKRFRQIGKPKWVILSDQLRAILDGERTFPLSLEVKIVDATQDLAPLSTVLSGDGIPVKWTKTKAGRKGGNLCFTGETNLDRILN